MWPEIPPVEPHERGIEELTGTRPHKGTLMYYRQLGVYDPYEAAEAPEEYNPGQRTSDLIYYLEQSHHHAPKQSHSLKGQHILTQDSDRSQVPRRKVTRQQVHPGKSRELLGPPRPGRATELFQQGRVRADHHVVDETNVCPFPPRLHYKPGPKFTFKKSPWNAACDSSFGDPRAAFEETRPPRREKLPRQPPLRARLKEPTNIPLPGYSEMDYAQHQPHGGASHHQKQHQQQQLQQQQQLRTSSSWKGGVNQPGQSFKRFHSGVVPYETDFNRKPKGWQSNYFHEDPTDFIFPQDDVDSWKSPSVGSGGGGGAQYGDYNARPKSWQGAGQEEEQDQYVPLRQRRSTFEQEDQYQQQYHQQQQQQHHQRPPGISSRPGQGSAAHRQEYAGPQQTHGGGFYESDDL